MVPRTSAPSPSRLRVRVRLRHEQRDPMNGLLTDLYELTMAAGYFAAGKANEIATFELGIRRLPPQRNFLLAAGLPQVVDYLLHLSFTPEEVDYLRGLDQFRQSPPE